jgi:hypothetical protein
MFWLIPRARSVGAHVCYLRYWAFGDCDINGSAQQFATINSVLGECVNSV